MELDDMDFVSAMDMELSKTSFPYFFQNVLGMMFPPYMEEWLESMQNTDRTVIICSRDHGKSVFMHCWVVWNLVFQEPPYQMLYISSNQKQTLVHMREIDRYFNHPALKKFRPSRNSRMAMRYLRGQLALRFVVFTHRKLSLTTR